MTLQPPASGACSSTGVQTNRRGRQAIRCPRGPLVNLLCDEYPYTLGTNPQDVDAFLGFQLSGRVSGHAVVVS